MDDECRTAGKKKEKSRWMKSWLLTARAERLIIGRAGGRTGTLHSLILLLLPAFFLLLPCRFSPTILLHGRIQPSIEAPSSGTISGAAEWLRPVSYRVLVRRVGCGLRTRGRAPSRQLVYPESRASQASLSAVAQLQWIRKPGRTDHGRARLLAVARSRPQVSIGGKRGAVVGAVPG